MTKNPYFNQGRLITFEEQESGIINILLFICISLMLLIFIFVSLFSRGIVNGESMLKTLNDGDNLLISRYTKNYQSGDIVILEVPDQVLVKRIVAVSGEKFMFQKVFTDNNYRQKVILVKYDNNDNPVPLEESYINDDMKIDSTSWQGGKHFVFDTVYEVPTGKYLYLGDNRNDSKDSRFYGYADKDSIIGKSVCIIPNNSFLIKIFDILFPEQKKQTV